MSKRYKAFISYSQLDKKWARKLQHALENYRVPAGVLAEFDTDKQKFGRVFRDDEDMSASESLGAALEGALDDSETLVVLCSPNSAKSAWVDMEVRRFKSTEGAKYFAVIVDGTPNATNADEECFPPALKVKVDEQGELTDTPDEPMAPDWRKDGLRKLTARLVAGILGVSFDELWNREQRRTRKLRTLTALASLTLVTSVAYISISTLRAQNNEAALQLIDLSQHAIRDAMSDRLEEDRGSNFERALRFSALGAYSSILHPQQPKAEALLNFVNQRAPIQSLLQGHRGDITSAGFITGHNRVFSAGDDGYLRTWDAASGAVLSEHGPAGEVLALSDSGTLAAIVYEDEERFYLWSTTEHKKVAELTIPKLPKFASFSANSAKLIAGNPETEEVGIWDTATGEKFATLKLAGAKPISGRLTADGSLASVASLEDRVTIWNADEATLLQQFETRVGRDQVLEFTPLDSRVVSGRRDDFYVFSLASGKVEGLLPGKVAYSADESKIAVAVEDNEVEIRNSADVELLTTLRGHEDEVVSLVWNDDGSKLLTASADATARLWNTSNARELARYEGHREALSSAQFNASENVVLTVSEDSNMRTYTAIAQASPMQKFELAGHQGRVNSLFYDPTNHHLLSIGRDKTVRIWDPQTARQMTVIEGNPTYGVDSVVYDAAAQRMVLTAIDGSVSVRNSVSGTEAAEYPVNQNTVDQRLLFTATFDRLATRAVTPNMGQAVVWDLTSGAQLSVLKPDQEQFYDITMSDDGTRAVSLSWEGITRVWNLDSGQQVAQLQGHAGLIESADFSPDGRWIVTAGQDTTAAVWNAESGEEIYTLSGFSGATLRVKFSPDGTLLAASNSDGSVRIFDVINGAEVGVLLGHTDGVNHVDFSDDAATVMTAGWDETVRLWDVNTSLELAKLNFETSIYAAALHPDASQVAVAVGEEELSLWNIERADAQQATLTAAQICAPHTGKLKGALRRITRGDIDAAPLLAERVDEDVCSRYGAP
ncbi:MAG: TIR domain-containing protein [Gammaproteobacteria bacterium]|nr:TIR domain-containing protein [Gammaproteobacteria bacterium]